MIHICRIPPGLMSQDLRCHPRDQPLGFQPQSGRRNQALEDAGHRLRLPPSRHRMSNNLNNLLLIRCPLPRPRINRTVLGQRRSAAVLGQRRSAADVENPEAAVPLVIGKRKWHSLSKERRRSLLCIKPDPPAKPSREQLRRDRKESRDRDLHSGKAWWTSDSGNAKRSSEAKKLIRKQWMANCQPETRRKLTSNLKDIHSTLPWETNQHPLPDQAQNLLPRKKQL